jgi:hypothetical protein
VLTREFVAPSFWGAYTWAGGRVVTDTVCLGYGDEGNLGSNARILSCPRHDTCRTVERDGAVLLGWTVGMVYVCRKCICNVHNAFCNRHGSKQPPVTADLSIDVLGSILNVLQGSLADFEFCPYREFDVWLAKWPLGKQKSILWSINHELSQPDKVKAMLKWEIYSKCPTKARLIQFYKSLHTQAIFAPAFTAAQKAITLAFNRRDVGGGVDITIASGMTANDIGDWMNWTVIRGAVLYYERDGKNWDSTMGEMAARFKRAIYTYFDQLLGAFVATCERVRGYVAYPTGIFRYKVDYTVRSGHNDTTLGNNLVNAAITLAACRRVGVRTSILVAGDDLLVAMYDSATCEDMVAAERLYGIRPEARMFSSPAQVSFISGIFLMSRGEWRFTPTPGRLLRRLWWSVAPPSDRNLDAHRRGVVLGLLPVCHDIPIVRVWLRKFEGEGRHLASTKGYVFKGSKYDNDDFMDQFCRRYDISPVDVAECEQYLECLPPSPLLIVHPVLERIVAVDEAEIDERGICAE